MLAPKPLRLVLASFCLVAAAAPTFSQTKDSSRPTADATRARLKPALDVPLRDSSICRDDAGRWYLTGTPAGDDGLFQNNDGVWLWTSADGADWKPLGQVWSIARDAKSSPASAWQQERRVNLDAPDGPLVRGITSPEIRFARGTFWIAYSMNAQGTGLLKSRTGKPEGPYVDLGRFTVDGTDASLFVDDDGTGHWLVGQGYLAPLNPEWTGLAAKPRLLRVAQWPSVAHANHKLPWTQAPLTIGEAGAHLFKAEGRYWLAGARVRDRMGAGCYDTFVAGADTLAGPYDAPQLMIPHGGQVTVFKNTDGSLAASFGGRERKAVFQDRAAIVPLRFTDAVLYATGKQPKFPAIMPGLVTEFGPWAEMRPAQDVGIRDLQFSRAPDGYVYMTGSGVDSRNSGKILLLRSRDLRAWETVDVQFDPRTIPGMTPAGYEERFVKNKGRGLADKFMDTEFYFAEGTYHFFTGLYALSAVGGGKSDAWSGNMWLRSTSGKPEGPYEYVDRAFSQSSAFRDDDGKWYVYNNSTLREWDPKGNGFQNSKSWRLSTDIGTPFEAGDVGSNLTKIDGKYMIFATGWNGASNGENERVNATYDKVYWQSDTLLGPYSMARYADPLPHSGHSCPVLQGPDGRWFGLLFGNDGTSPWLAKPGVLVYDVTQDKAGTVRITLKDERQ